jgi:tyrosinase
MRRWTSPPLERPDIDEEPFTRADLVFYGVDHSGPSFEGLVFLNNPQAGPDTTRTADNGYAGSFKVFGHGGCFGDEGHCHVVQRPVDPYDLRPPHPLEPWTLTVIATDAIAAVETTELTVTVVAVVPEEEHDEGSDVLTLDHVRLATYAA